MSTNFRFMFTRVKDERDAVRFLHCVILPDFYGWDQTVTPEDLEGIVKEWGTYVRLSARNKRLIRTACEEWNARVVKAA